MPNNVIPVVLQFSNVASDSNLSLTFTTPGVRWSLGHRIGDSLGFSYNVLPDGVYDSAPCLQSVSFNDDLLSLTTSSAASSLMGFTLTLFIEVDEGINSLAGYCTLNNEAVVLAYLGNQRPALWRNGRISAVIGVPTASYRSVLFTIKGLKPSTQVDIALGTDSSIKGGASWVLGSANGNALGVSIGSKDGGSVPLSMLSYTDNRIVMQSGAESGSSATAVVMLAYVAWQPEDLKHIYLRASADPAVSVYAQVGARQPQWVSPAYTLFTL
ncbi:hypothetical protein [Pseudoxanthomonas broegbernensis]|uniref:hypothetical protein n=1 Tax=Pseudoxanthomonas broegbernensis TaxID=83619 RepID=UPI001391ABDB|nr:hypothetical protein [Pseudoxanthomonas broegbernensis]MBB6064896.1 hypothetical protein [Pseudoxanthomonas broegbernensis]